VRLFFAIELGDALRTTLDHAIAPLRAAEPSLAWVRAERLHLTMKFLGEVDGAGAARLTRAADAVAARHRPFEMTLGGIGAFPNFRRARVVWIGVESDPRLELLHHDLELACGEEGFEVEGRPFRPHITLARVRTPMALEQARPFARAARRVAYAASDEVLGLGLLESVPGAGGEPYRRVHAAPLGGC
jgi:RNA 2',3'-cyclic 3'-phosphodiesterase